MRRGPDRVFDELLVLNAQAGRRTALDRLAQRWLPRLLAHAHRNASDPELARDAVQDAWVDIVRGLDRLSDPAAFPAWAYRIVSRRCADAGRKRARARVLAEAAAQDAEARPPEPGPDDSVDAATARAAFRALPEGHRAVAALFYIEDFSVAEIAASLGLPAGTVKTRLFHAREKLKRAVLGATNDQT